MSVRCPECGAVAGYGRELGHRTDCPALRQRPLFHIPRDARRGKEPCGECHLRPGETCDICGATQAAAS